MPLFRALAKNMAPMTNADESPTNRLTLFPIYLSLFIVSTLCCGAPEPKMLQALFRCHQADIRMCSHRLLPLDDNKSVNSIFFISGTITFSHSIGKKMKHRYQSFTRIGRQFQSLERQVYADWTSVSFPFCQRSCLIWRIMTNTMTSTYVVIFLSVSIFGRGYHSRYQNFEFTVTSLLQVANKLTMQAVKHKTYSE